MVPNTPTTIYLANWVAVTRKYAFFKLVIQYIIQLVMLIGGEVSRHWLYCPTLVHTFNHTTPPCPALFKWAGPQAWISWYFVLPGNFSGPDARTCTDWKCDLNTGNTWGFIGVHPVSLCASARDVLRDLISVADTFPVSSDTWCATLSIAMPCDSGWCFEAFAIFNNHLNKQNEKQWHSNV